MPRGSRPGERRGGRQRGTLNKKTILRNAAIGAAAAGSNLSPLDLLLGLMREPNLPLELRISVAHEALPYVHSKRQDRHRFRAQRYGARRNGVNAEPLADSGPRVKTANVAAPQRDDGPEVTPLGFLLGVMADADTPAHLRIRVAAIVAPYVHARRAAGDPSKNPVENVVVVDDPYGFKVEPAVARAFRDDKQRLAFLWSLENYPYNNKFAEERETLANRIAEIGKTLECPPGYKGVDARADALRLKTLDRKPDQALTAAEDAEQAHLIARIEAYKACPTVQAARTREIDLQLKKVNEPLTPAEESELAVSQAHSPYPPYDITKEHSYRSYLAITKVLKEAPNRK
jgi:hypothetical protein